MHTELLILTLLMLVFVFGEPYITPPPAKRIWSICLVVTVVLWYAHVLLLVGLAIVPRF